MKKNNNYFVGLDLGTTTVGWAVTNEDYELLHLRRKPAIGVNLFEEASTAKDRRNYRSVRRRLARRKHRILLLQALFAEEISKVDPTFFLRLNNSAYFKEDKDTKLKGSKNTLFDDENYKDKDFFKEYPTIYHLQKEIINNGKKKYDIRHIYLAIHHLIKYRGNFIKEDQNFDIEKFTDMLVNDAFVELYDYFNETEFLAGQELFSAGNIKKYKAILNDKKIGGMTKTAERIFDTFNIKDKYLKQIVNLSLGRTVKLGQIFSDDIVDKDQGKESIDFQSDTFEEKYMDIAGLIGEEHMRLIDELKNLYDYFTITRLMGGKKFVAEAMVEKHEKHKKDLRILKDIFIKYGTKEEYRRVFTILYTLDEKGKKKAITDYNYPRYIGNKDKDVTLKHLDYSEFAKFIKKMFTTMKIDSLDEVKVIIQELDDRTFLPRISSKDNATIPYQFNEFQLERILTSQSVHYPFFNQKGKDTLTTAGKILSILRFRIPYYVGPLVSQKDHPFSWVKRMTNEKVTPWNFSEVIDEAESAKRFIERMTNKCSYIPTEDVLPKESILYERYDVLNRINSIKINNALIDSYAKDKILRYLEENKAPLTKKKLISLLSTTKTNAVVIDGFQDDEKLVLSSHHKFKNILKDHRLSDVKKEEIIFYRTIFTDQKMFEKKLKEIVKDTLPLEVVEGLKKLKFKGWGRLSRAFLTGYSKTLNTPILVDKKTAEVFSIIEIMENEVLTLQEVLHDPRYKILELIRDYNRGHLNDNLSFVDLVENSYLSPSVKRPVLKAMFILKELIKINGGTPPKKIFLEMTRSDVLAKKGKKTKSRKDQLAELYKKAQRDSKELKELLEELNGRKENDFKSRRLFLYYLQQGKCLYTGVPLRLEELHSGTYDIEHIIPQSLKVDDSFDNICLVNANINKRKGDTYPLPREIINVEKMKPFWESLKEKGFMSEDKYQRLIRITPLSDEEKLQFINRQLVETGQANKMVAELIKEQYGDIVVYSKAQNISRFRQKFDFIKLRDLNKAHHAHDAYLNIIVGNYYDSITRAMAIATKKNLTFTFNLSNAFTEKKRENVWDKNRHIPLIKKVLEMKKILFTRGTMISTGEFYDQNLSSARDGKLSAVKQSGPLSDVSKYGGYSNLSTSHFVIADIGIGKRTSRRIIPVKLIDYLQIKAGKNTIDQYIKDEANTNNVKVIIDLLPIGFLIKRGNTVRSIAGISTGSLYANNHNEPYFSKVFENGYYLLTRYIKAIDLNDKEILKSKEQFTIHSNDNKKRKTQIVNSDSNGMLFEELIKHFSKSIYKNIFEDVSKKLEDKKEDFNNSSIYEQVSTLLQLVELLQSGPLRRSIDLVNVGLNKTISMNLMSNEVKEGDKLLIQSITGLYEKEILIG